MKVSLTTKNVVIFLFCSVLTMFAVFVAFFVKDFFYEQPEIFSPEIERGITQDQGNQECIFSIEEKIVRGNSMVPLVKDGQVVRVLFGYYNCNEIKRQDIVLYDYAGNQNPLIKIVKGVPGDKFALRKTDRGWNILINGEVVKNSEGIPYLISGKKYKMLALYEKDYQGLIPDNAYLLLGNLPSGSMDSIHYGLVHKNDILGKVEVLYLK